MGRIFLLTVLISQGFIFSTATFSFTEEDKSSEKELAKLSGSWIPQSAELGGQKLPEDFLGKVSLLISGNTYSSKVGTQADKGNLKLNSLSRPKTMDIIGTEGPNQGKTFPAIYEFAGNTLMICYDLESKKRPEAFKSLPGSQIFFVTYKRESK